ncbi:MAG: hypothetical protein ABIS14_05770 [Sphingomonas sp.]
MTEAAAKLRVTRQAVSNLVGWRAGLSAEKAIRFEKAFKLSADTLMQMQAAHDLASVRARAGTLWWSGWRLNRAQTPHCGLAQRAQEVKIGIRPEPQRTELSAPP